MPMIQTEALTKRYGSVTAVSELSVDVEPGVVGLIGANGAGKSTLIKMVLGLLPADVRPGDRAGAGRRHRRGRDPRAGRVHARARLPAAGRVGDRAGRAHGPDVRAAPGRRPRTHRGHPAPRRALRGAVPVDRRLLDRHEAAGQARAGAGPRPPAGAAGRADERPRPRRSRRHARADPPDRHRVRHLRPGRVAPARRAGTRLRPRRRDRRGPAAAVVLHRRRDRRQPADRRRGRPSAPTTWPPPSGRPGSVSRRWARCSRSTCATTRRTTWCATPSSGSGWGWCGWNAVGTGWPRSSRRPRRHGGQHVDAR